jgi:hypothetical protein
MSEPSSQDETQALEAAPSRGPGLGWSAAALAAATLFLFLFNAASIRSWTASLPPDPANLTLREAAKAWEGETTRLGLATPRMIVRRFWERQTAVSWKRPEPTPPDQR